MISQRVWGNLGVNLIHPPKLCAGLLHTIACVRGTRDPRLRAREVAAERSSDDRGSGSAGGTSAAALARSV